MPPRRSRRIKEMADPSSSKNTPKRRRPLPPQKKETGGKVSSEEDAPVEMISAPPSALNASAELEGEHPMGQSVCRNSSRISRHSAFDSNVQISRGGPKIHLLNGLFPEVVRCVSLHFGNRHSINSGQSGWGLRRHSSQDPSYPLPYIQ